MKIYTTVCSPCIACCESNNSLYYVSSIRILLEDGMKSFMRVLGPVLLVFGVALILTVVVMYQYLLLYRPLLLFISSSLISSNQSKDRIDFNSGYIIFAFVYSVLNIFCGFNVFFNYYFCVKTKPGSPRSNKDSLRMLEQTVIGNIDGRRIYSSSSSAVNVSPGVSYRHCKKCRCIKPPRCKFTL